MFTYWIILSARENVHSSRNLCYVLDCFPVKHLNNKNKHGSQTILVLKI